MIVINNKKNLKISKINNFIKFKKKKDLTLCLPPFLSGFTLYFEAKGRRGEIMLYVMSTFYECLWNFLKKRHLVFDIPMGQVIIFYFLFFHEKIVKMNSFLLLLLLLEFYI